MSEMTRRHALTCLGCLTAGTVASWGNGSSRGQNVHAEEPVATPPLAPTKRIDEDHDKKPRNVAEALAWLKVGNERFARGETWTEHESPTRRHHLVSGQHPFAAVIGCADSRVPVEMLFDQGLGDLFTVRVAGNIITPDTLGSLHYALEHLHTPLCVVLGHEGCGAITAGLEMKLGHVDSDRHIKVLVDMLEPVLNDPTVKNLDPSLPLAKKVSAAVVANVRLGVKQMRESLQDQPWATKEKLQIVGAVYDLDSGLVRYLD